MLMALTTEGALRKSQIGTDALVFAVREIAYGDDGWDTGSPELPLALNPADTALISEVHRKAVASTIVNTYAIPRGQETTFTTLGGGEYLGIIGEAGIYAEVTDPGTTGLALGYTFLLAHAHFGRLHVTPETRLAIKWPIQYN